ncbi:hypothetical protein [Gordonia malaquae]
MADREEDDLGPARDDIVRHDRELLDRLRAYEEAIGLNDDDGGDS